MSFTITEAFVQQFQKTFHMDSQQTVSRLEMYARRYPGMVVGEAFTVDRLGTSNAQPNRPRHSDLTYQDLATERRFADMSDLEPAELIDAMDKLKLLIEPGNQYSESLIADCNRFKDKILINAMLGSARTRSGSIALPSGQKIANGATALTLAKLREAKKRLDNAEMDNSDFFRRTGQHMAKQDPYGNLAEPSYVLVCTTSQINDLLADTVVTSVDQNSVKALVSGSINTFMGFMFVHVPEAFLPKVSTIRSCIAYAPKAIEYGLGKETTSKIERIAHKNAWQVLAEVSCGAVRAQDKGVVQIDVVES